MLDMPSLSRNVSHAPSGNPAPRRRQRRNPGPYSEYYRSGVLVRREAYQPTPSVQTDLTAVHTEHDQAYLADVPSETRAIYHEIFELVQSEDMKQLRMEIIREVSLFIKESINLERQYRQEENARNQPSSGNNA